jgi:hypothetical protein
MSHFTNQRSISETCAWNFCEAVTGFWSEAIIAVSSVRSPSPFLCLLASQQCRWCTELAPTPFPVAPLTVLGTDLKWFDCIWLGIVCLLGRILVLDIRDVVSYP